MPLNYQFLRWFGAVHQTSVFTINGGWLGGPGGPGGLGGPGGPGGPGEPGGPGGPGGLWQ